MLTVLYHKMCLVCHLHLQALLPMVIRIRDHWLYSKYVSCELILWGYSQISYHSIIWNLLQPGIPPMLCAAVGSLVTKIINMINWIIRCSFTCWYTKWWIICQNMWSCILIMFGFYVDGWTNGFILSGHLLTDSIDMCIVTMCQRLKRKCSKRCRSCWWPYPFSLWSQHVINLRKNGRCSICYLPCYSWVDCCIRCITLIIHVYKW